MTGEVRVDFSGYSIRNASRGSSGEILLLDFNKRQFRKMDNGDDRASNSNYSRFDQKPGHPDWDGSFVYAVQRCNNTLSVSCMLQAQSQKDIRGGSMPGVRVELPQGYMPENPEAFVRFVTSLAEGFEKTFIRNKMQTPAEGKNFSDACLNIVKSSPGTIPLKAYSGQNVIPTIISNTAVSPPNRHSSQTDEQYTLSKRDSMESWASYAVEHFIKNPALKEVVITSQHNARNLSDSIKIEDNVKPYPPGKEPPPIIQSATMPAIDPRLVEQLKTITGPATETGGQITLATKDVPMPNGKKGELG